MNGGQVMTRSSNQTDPSSVTLAILAGGQGSRMGGPKGEIRIVGRPILEYLLKRFSWPGPTLLVTAPGREHPQAWEKFDREVVDPVPDQGPLRGILTALENLKTPMLLVATVDMPGIQTAQLIWLLDEMRKSADRLGLMLRRSAHVATVEPFPSIFCADARETISRRIQAGKLSVQKLIEENGFETIPAPASWDSRTWANLNVPADLKNFTDLMG